MAKTVKKKTASAASKNVKNRKQAIEYIDNLKQLNQMQATLLNKLRNSM